MLDLFDGARRLYTNMLLTAVDQAAIAWIEQYPGATSDQLRQMIPQQVTTPGQSSPAGPCAPYGVGPWWMQGTGKNYRPGTVMKTEGNRQFIPRPDSPVTGFEVVEKLAMRAARMRWNLPGSASGDAEDTTFAAAIQAGGPFPVAVEGSQLHWGSCFERPAALKVFDRAVEAGLLTREERAELDVEVTEPAVVTPEPEKDTQRYQTEHQAGVLSATTWQLKAGYDPQHEAANFKAEKEREGQQQPPAPGAPGPTPPGNPPPDAGGGGGDIFGESLSEGQYLMLSEGGRAGLVQKDVQVHRDGKTVTQKRWVKADAPAAKPATAAEPSPTAGKEHAASERRRKDAVAAEHARATRQEPPRPKHLEAATKFHDVARRRRIVAALKTEAEVAEAVGGFNEPDSRPADVLYVEDADGNRVTDPERVKNALKVREASVKLLKTGKVHKVGDNGRVVATDQDADEGYRSAAEAILARRCEAFEVKTLLTSAKHAVYMNPAAKRRKELYAKRHMVNFSVVAVDKRRGGKHSGHGVYVAPYADVSKSASGTVKLDQMKKVDSLAGVMGALA